MLIVVIVYLIRIHQAHLGRKMFYYVKSYLVILLFSLLWYMGVSNDSYIHAFLPTTICRFFSLQECVFW